MSRIRTGAESGCIVEKTTAEKRSLRMTGSGSTKAERAAWPIALHCISLKESEFRYPQAYGSGIEHFPQADTFIVLDFWSSILTCVKPSAVEGKQNG
jgi:hypothetical protein